MAASTRTSYDTVVRQFGEFCGMRGMLPPYLPARWERVEAWIAHEAGRMAVNGLSKKTLKRKIAGLVSWHVDVGHPTAGIINPRIERVIAGANRYHGVSTKAQPLPLTLPILRKVVCTVMSDPFSYGGVRSSKAVVAAFTLAFACFMRMGELTFDSFDGSFDLRRDSVQVVDGEWRLTIPASKTDRFRMGVTVVIPEGEGVVCPRRGLRGWFEVRRGGGDGPLFDFNGGPFRRRTLVGYLEKALVENGYAGGLFSGHSFRRGAATWASSIGMSEKEIKTLGRWNSDCYRLYIDAGEQRNAAIGKKLLNAAAKSTLPASGLPRPGDVWRPAL